MTAQILRLPVRPTPRPVPNEAQLHFEREMQAIAVSLHDASGRFGLLPSRAVCELSISKGAQALETALFHALTLDGCKEDDRMLRQLLLFRLSLRENSK